MSSKGTAVCSATFAGALAFLAGCSASGLPAEPVEEGRKLFNQPGFSASGSPFACASCHPLDAESAVRLSRTPVADAGAQGDAPGDGGLPDELPAAFLAADRLRPGMPLAGVTRRPTFWGGQELTLRAAIDDCRLHFMGSATPLDVTSPEAEALLAYLDSLAPADTRAQPFTIVPLPREVGPGDADRGAIIYEKTCAFCHGTAREGAGKLESGWPTLPQEVNTVHPNEPPSTVRIIFVEKIRHGGFLGYTGRMPPFAAEVLDDAAIADILAYLQLPM